MKQQSYKVGAYLRLSRDDENIEESGSIGNQREIIKQYCQKNSLIIEGEYIDDGFTGTNFNRPDFQRLLTDIENGKINCVITKDLSRLGRDYIMTGYYLEIYFPQKSVRYIAIGDNYDTASNNHSSNDFATFKMVYNDLYAKDISNKVRMAFKAKALKGEHLTTVPPYGYRKDPDVPNHLIPDEETAPNIKLIFDLYVNEGYGSCKIRDYLREHRIMTPAAILLTRGYRKHYHLDLSKGDDALYYWNEQTVYWIIKDELYLGHSIHFRSQKANNKSKTRKMPRSEWLIIENTHEPLIDKETFDKAQKRLALRKKAETKHDNIFMGIVKCADCGRALNLMTSIKNGIARGSLCCNTYRKYSKSVCTAHLIRYDNLVEIIRHRLNTLISMAKLDEEKLIAKLKKIKSSPTVNNSVQKKIATHEKRLAEIDRVFMKLYEDRALGTITDANYKLMSSKLATEQERITPELESLKAQVTDATKSSENIINFVELIKSVSHIEVLDEITLRALVDKIAVGEVETTDIGKEQPVDIDYKFIGKIPELTA